MTDPSKLVEWLRAKEPHTLCDDCWYSCPASGECCNPDAGKECNCGADERNALREEAATALASRSDDYRRGLEDAAKMCDDETESGEFYARAIRAKIKEAG